MHSYRAVLSLCVLCSALLPSCGSEDAGAPRKRGPDASAGCRPGELALPDATCQPAGVPEDGCATGFEADSAQGCRAILPDAACPKGQLAVPGDPTCHDVAPCGDGTWGDIPVETTTQF